MTEQIVKKTLIDEGIALISFNRPEKRNALNIDLMRAFCHIMESLSNMRAVIINGEGPAFCSGLDLEEAQDPSKEEASAELLAHTFLLISKASFVTIAAVEGAALAGGAGIMAACDVVVAADNVRIAFPEVLRGLVPAQIASILSRQIGWRDLRELLLFGNSIDAAKAQKLGLINHLVPAGEARDEALKLGRASLKGAPGALRMTKQLLYELSPEKLDESLLKTMSLHHVSRHSDEAKEGIEAFLEKRKPSWI